jgi:hypothetical protein
MIFKFQNYSELLHQKNELSKNLTDLQNEKSHLEEKLKYLKSLKTKPEKEEEPKNYIDLIDLLETSKSKVLQIRERTEIQQIKIVNVREVCNQIWKNLGIDPVKNFDLVNSKEMFRDLYLKIKDLEEGRLRRPHVPKSQWVRAKTKVWDAVVDKKLFGKSFESSFGLKGK